MRGGELSNSHGEPDYLRAAWPKLKALNLNTVVAPVYWDLIEPAEGRFDFATVDGLIADARASEMRLVLLWFGSWKNSMSCYVPAWVKTDSARFPRARNSAGQAMEILTPFAAANRDTDARAFAALMKHLRETDGTQHTVIIVQVENEIGMIPEARDRHPAADAAFAASVPAEFMAYLTAHRDTLAPRAARNRWIAHGAKAAGTWTQVFGEGPATSELFMAWSFGCYVEKVAAAGRAEYALPLYANAALIRPAYQPGQYPSAGPLPHLSDVWRAAAPTLDFISPDIYFPNFAEWADRYARAAIRCSSPRPCAVPDAAVNNLYAFGACSGFGFFAVRHRVHRRAGRRPAARQQRSHPPAHAADHRASGAGDHDRPAATRRGAAQVARHPLRRPDDEHHLRAARIAGLADGVINEAGDRSANRATLPAGAIVLQLGPDEFLFGRHRCHHHLHCARARGSVHRHSQLRGRPLR